MPDGPSRPLYSTRTGSPPSASVSTSASTSSVISWVSAGRTVCRLPTADGNVTPGPGPASRAVRALVAATAAPAPTATPTAPTATQRAVGERHRDGRAGGPSAAAGPTAVGGTSPASSGRVAPRPIRSVASGSCGATATTPASWPPTAALRSAIIVTTPEG